MIIASAQKSFKLMSRAESLVDAISYAIFLFLPPTFTKKETLQSSYIMHQVLGLCLNERLELSYCL